MIRDSRELRREYDTLDLYYKVIKEVREKMPDKDVTSVLDKIVEKKREIRKYHKSTEKKDRHLVKDKGIDGYIELIELPDYIESREEAKEYFESEEELRCLPSAYDCTGQLFTGWYKIFKRRGKWMAYHSICCDV